MSNTLTPRCHRTKLRLNCDFATPAVRMTPCISREISVEKTHKLHIGAGVGGSLESCSRRVVVVIVVVDVFVFGLIQTSPCPRNWHWDEPSCGGEMCAVLYYQPLAPPDEEGHFLFQWNDDNCNSRNNYVCKYAEGERRVPPGRSLTVHCRVR